MTSYFLKDKNNPAINFFGTAEEIWRHTTEKGYAGETQTLDGYPVPKGKSILIENGEDKRTSAISLKAKYWFKIDQMQRESAKFKSQGTILEEGLRALDLAKNFGPVYATTPEGIKKFNSLIEFIMMKPYFDAVGFSPVLSQEKVNIN